MKRNVFWCCLFALLFATTASAEDWAQSIEVLAKAEPDECYAGVGVDYPPPNSDNPFTCPQGSLPKRNQTYLWGLTRWGNSLWFGTGPNVMCTTGASFMGMTDPLVTPPPPAPPSMVCEFGESQIAREDSSIPDSLGDLRPPKIYEYDLDTGILHDRTPDDPLIGSSKGLRSAGAHDGLIFLAGGDMNNGISMFAFDAVTKEYLGSTNFTNYFTIRKWLVVQNVLYTGVASLGNGKILRWRGDRNDLWNFEEVGQVSGFPRELAEVIDSRGRSRIAVNSIGIWISPVIRRNGLTRWQARRWTEVWNPSSYEPDQITLSTYGGGDLHFFDGWLYFMTMHVPNWAMGMHDCSREECFGPATPGSEEYDELLWGTHRAASVWRIRAFDTSNPEIQLLYGENRLPAYNSATGQFELVPNVGGYDPLYGPSGFGNPYNIYGWTMTVADNRLFAGTSDASPMFFRGPGGYGPLPPPPGDNPAGADLWRFDSSNQPAVAEFTDGGGYPSSGGVRCLIASGDGKKLFIGTATTENLNPAGGWHLLQLDSEH